VICGRWIGDYVKHVFIINPVAGMGEEQKKIVEKIQNTCEQLNVQYCIHTTKKAHEATEYVKNMASSYDGPIRFYACGGDGTVFEVVNGVYGNENAEFAVIPLGSGNDFIRSFGSREEFLDIEQQIKASSNKIDLIKCGDRVAVNECSMGFDAEICSKQNMFKHHPLIAGPNSYMVATVIYCILKKNRNEFTITIDDNPPYKKKVTLVLAANCKWYGGGFLGAPKAQADDGLLDFIIIDHFKSKINMLRFLALYRKGKHIDKKNKVTFVSGKKINIKSDSLAASNVDGEWGMDRELTFEVIEKGIKFSIPDTTFYRREEKKQA
jgi:YegS/Rv2252/BmrU family lipid kinase